MSLDLIAATEEGVAAEKLEKKKKKWRCRGLNCRGLPKVEMPGFELSGPPVCKADALPHCVTSMSGSEQRIGCQIAWILGWFCWAAYLLTLSHHGQDDEGTASYRRRMVFEKMF